MDLETLLRVGRQALASGQLDSALTILSSAAAKAPDDPRAWFYLAGVYVKHQRQDTAAMCFYKASTLSGNGGLQEVARDNALLCSVKVLPRDWAPAACHPVTAAAWESALQHLAATISGAEMAGAAVPGAGRGLHAPDAVAVVVGGLGLQATRLAQLLTSDSAKRGTGGAVQGKGQAAGAVQVVSCHADSLTEALSSKLAEANSVLGQVLVQSSLQAWVTSQQQWEKAESRQAGKGQSVVMCVVCPDSCSSIITLQQLRRTMQQVQPLLGPGALVCPSAVRVRAALVHSQDLVDMNEVRLPDLLEDTGLDYRACNELLWRNVRPMQVDRLQYSLLSPPFDLQHTSTQLLGTAQPSSAQPSRSTVHTRCTATGQFDCVVVWTEQQLAPDQPWLSNAPCQLQAEAQGPGNTAHTQALLAPHRWQHVHYLPMRPQVACGQKIELVLQWSGDQLRIELDEDCLLHVSTQDTASAAPTTASNGLSPDSLPLGEALEGQLPAGEPLLGGGEDSASSSGSEAEGSKNLDKAGAGLILSYHMCMLNDHERTRMYRDATQSAVKRMLAQEAEGPKGQGGEARSPPVVLDIGAGTGLLSLMAAQGGAPCVIGVERELPLVMAASKLAQANGLEHAAACVHSTSNSMRTMPASSATSAGEGEAMLVSGPGGTLLLRTPPALVVHEIFGSDPLSEHILLTMRHIKANVAAPSTRFLPASFSVIAALAHTHSLHHAVCSLPPSLPAAYGHGPQAGGSSEAGEGAEGRGVVTDAAAGPQADGGSVAESLDLRPLSPWVPTRVECNLMHVPDLQLLTHPQSVLLFDLEAEGPLELQGGKGVCLAACLPTPVAEFAASGHCRAWAGTVEGTAGTAESMGAQEPAAPHEGGSGDQGAGTGLQQPNCVVYWFSTDMGGGNTLCTAPGSPCTYFGHWAQCVDFVVGAPVLTQEEGEGAGYYRVQAAFLMDRVRIRAA